MINEIVVCKASEYPVDLNLVIIGARLAEHGITLSGEMKLSHVTDNFYGLSGGSIVNYNLPGVTGITWFRSQGLLEK